MKNITKSILAITFSLALIVPVVANSATPEEKPVKTEKCEKDKKCCTKEEKKCCSEAKTCESSTETKKAE